MKWLGRAGRPFVSAIVLFLAVRAARPEVVEEVVAWVNGEIITKSEMDQEEQMLLSEVYRRKTGADLDAEVKNVRTELLSRMIDRKILIQRAARIYDVQKMGDNLLDEFKDSQKIKSDDDLRRLLAQDGLTLEELKQRLIEMYAPEQVIRSEVIGRIGIPDDELQAYYVSHPELSAEPARATVREIVLLTDSGNREAKRTQAEAIRARASEPGADFAAIAKEVSEAPSGKNGGLLGEIGKGDLAPAIEDEAFRVPVGQVSPVIELAHGFHVLFVEARKETRNKPFAEMREEIRDHVEQDKYSKALGDYLKKARAESEILVKDKYRDRLSWKAGS